MPDDVADVGHIMWLFNLFGLQALNFVCWFLTGLQHKSVNHNHALVWHNGWIVVSFSQTLTFVSP